MVKDATTWCGCAGCPCPSSCGCVVCPCQSYVAPEVVNKLNKCTCEAPPCSCDTRPRVVQSHVPSICGCPSCPCQPMALTVRPMVVSSLDEYIARMQKERRSISPSSRTTSPGATTS